MQDSGLFELVITADGKRNIVPLRLGTASIGRDPTSSIRLHDRSVSRYHARLLRENRKVWAEDLGSQNGIFLNGERVDGRIRVFHNDVLRIGDVELQLTGVSLRHRGDETTDRSLASVDLQDDHSTPIGLSAQEKTEIVNRHESMSALPFEATMLVRRTTPELPAAPLRRGGLGSVVMAMVGLSFLGLVIAGISTNWGRRPLPFFDGSNDLVEDLVNEAETAASHQRWREVENITAAALAVKPENLHIEQLHQQAQREIIASEILAAAKRAFFRSAPKESLDILRSLEPNDRTAAVWRAIDELRPATIGCNP